jgi:hypothetical protein
MTARCSRPILEGGRVSRLSVADPEQEGGEPVASKEETTVAPEDNKVAIHTMMRDTHRDEFFGTPPTGKQVSYPGVHIVRIADGKIAEHWGSNDDLGLMRQLGAIPAPS